MSDAFPLRHPALAVASAFATGILVDRWMAVPLTGSLSLAAICATAWAAAYWSRVARLRFGRIAATLLLVWVAALGAARHHLFWSTFAANDVSFFAGDRPRLVKLQADVINEPEVVSPPVSSRSVWARHETTVATLRCRRLDTSGKEIPVAGRASLRVTGRLSEVHVGDEIQITGWLSRPQTARNPGAFDPSDFYRRLSASCLITANHAGAVTRTQQGSQFSLMRTAASLRDRGETMFARDLAPRTAPVATALLFGTRAQMDEEIRDAFVESGLMHVLAISGMHVAILAILLWGLGRLFGLSVPAICLVTMIGVVGYAFLTDCRPPVVRATILVCLYAGSRFWFRRPALPNALAVAAIAILLWNPSDLFDVGTQLSFLGVFAILWAARLLNAGKRHRDDWPQDAQREEPGAARLFGGFAWSRMKEGWMISVTAALFAMPLVAARFHIVSPVGILINVVLCPLATVVLWLGYLHLGIGLVIPWASHVVGIPFDLGLSTLIGLVQLAARVKLSHVYVAGPPAWWLAGYYSLLFALVFMPSVRRTGCRGWSTLAAWTIVGLAWGLRSPAPQGLRCTFLSVGHGEAILLEGPAGGTLLYDAGAIEDGRVAQRAVQSTLWERRRTQIDALVASHADIDHFNGMTGLMQSLPVGELLVSQQFLDFRQPAVVALCNASDACHVPIKLVRDGDRLRLDDGVELTVLHPRPGRPQADDNANSIVLSIEFAGRRILLTGDLEGSGQASLLSQPPRPTDILLAPHHGSRKANSAALARWARPRQVIVSGGPRTDFHSLRSAYGPQAEILSTDDYGAITFDIHPDGTIERTTVRHPEVHR